MTSKLVVLAAALMVAPQARPHHSIAPYDMTRSVTVAGVVDRFFWVNPHSYIFLDGQELDAESGAETPHRWRLELEASAVLRRQGWTKDSVQPGDRVRCTGARAKAREKFLMKCRSVELADGRKLAS